MWMPLVSIQFFTLLCLIWCFEATSLPWIEILEAKNYVVQEGSYGFFDTTTCASADTCYAINPLTPYGLIYLPPHANETSSRNYSNSCHRHGLCKELQGRTYSPSWRIAPGEVILLIGRTPPESTYWSFAPSLYTRFNGPGFKPKPRSLQDLPVACPRVPEGSVGSRCEVFSAVNDPVNFQTVNVSTQTPFNSSFALMLSWDSETEKEVALQLEAAGVGPLNFLRHPGAISRLGVTKGTEDEFINVMRVENIKDGEASRRFYDSTPFQVLRISRSLEMPPAPESFYGSFKGRMRSRVTGHRESGENVTNQQLRDGLKLLKQRVIQERQHLLDVTSLDFNSFVNDSGYECLQSGLQCQGDCRDTIYARATMLIQETLCNKSHLPCRPSRHAELSNESSDSFFVLGVNHKMTNQSLYSSLTAYNYPKLAAGILKRTSGDMQYSLVDEDFKGSALELLPDHPAAPYLYVVKFARRCLPSDRHVCVEVPSWAESSNVTAIAEGEPLVFIERMYIHPGTKSGPAVAETIMPILVHFKHSRAQADLDEQTEQAVFV